MIWTAHQLKDHSNVDQQQVTKMMPWLIVWDGSPYKTLAKPVATTVFDLLI
jgi:hypothetical protein